MENTEKKRENWSKNYEQKTNNHTTNQKNQNVQYNPYKLIRYENYS